MSFANSCKECSCWCLFTLTSIFMLVMFSLALKDMSLVSEQQAMLQQIINLPIPQLSCIEICESWYSQEKGMHCCDRYNMDLCVAKQKCKIDYIRGSQVTIKILENDQLHQIVVVVVCALVLVMIGFRKRSLRSEQKIKQGLHSKIMEIMKDILKEGRKQKTEETIIRFDELQLKNENSQKNESFSTTQENSSHLIPHSLDQKIIAPVLAHKGSNNPCQHSQNLSIK